MPRSKKQSPPITPPERILAAAFEEFATHRFDTASTNQIAKEAKVAKGLLFHYFKSKEELYLMVVEQALTRMNEHFWGKFETAPADLFERIRYWSTIRLKMVHQEPKLYHLLTMAIVDVPAALRPKVAAMLGPIQKRAWEEMIRGIDTSRLRGGVSLQQAVELLMIFSTGLEQRMTAILATSSDHGLTQIEALTQQAQEYLALIRDGLYQG